MSILGIASGVLSAGSAIYGAIRSRKAAKEQQKRQKELQEHAKDKQLEIWNKTNYGAQRRHLENAGLNTGLLYGMGGTGGATTGSVGAGQAGAENVYDIGRGLDRAMQMAQVDVAKSQAEKNRAEADKIKGVDTSESKARTLDLLQGVENKKAQEILTKTQTRLNELQQVITETQGKLDTESYNDRMKKIAAEASKAEHENDIASNESEILEKTKSERIKQIKIETITMGLQQLAIQAGIKLSNAQTEQIKHLIEQKWQDVFANWTNLDLKEREIKINQFKAEIDANYPGIWNAAGAGAIQLSEWLGIIMTGGKWWEGIKGHKVDK